MWTLALILHILHFSYHQLITNPDLFPSKKISTYNPPKKFPENGLHAIIFGFAIVVLYFRNESLTGIAAAGLGLLVINEFRNYGIFIFSKFFKKEWAVEPISREKLQVLPHIKTQAKPGLATFLLNATTLFCFISMFWIWQHA